jgi:hypothetical protein
MFSRSYQKRKQKRTPADEVGLLVFLHHEQPYHNLCFLRRLADVKYETRVWKVLVILHSPGILTKHWMKLALTLSAAMLRTI